MSQDFKRSLNKMLDNNPTSARKENGIEYYKERGFTRTLKFVQPDGMQVGLSYHNLVSTEYDEGNETISLAFTTHTVILKGKNLSSLHDEFLKHGPKIIETGDERYNLLAQGMPVVNIITITRNS